MKIAVAMLQQWHRENPARLLQAALSQAEHLAQMAPELESLRAQNASAASRWSNRLLIGTRSRQRRIYAGQPVDSQGSTNKISARNESFLPIFGEF